jgi:hypothetical protein
MRALFSGMRGRFGMSQATTIWSQHVTASIRRGPVLWLILCGVILVAAIIIGTVAMVGEFRERALNNGTRELENTVLLLTRHFDQQFEDSEIIATDMVSKMEFLGDASPENFKSRMATFDAHLMLKSKVSVLSYIGDVNIFDADGQLINSSSGWPVPDNINIADRAYFKTFKSDPESKIALAEPVRSYFTDKWTTVIAHRLNGPGGVFLGVMARRIDPVNFEKFFASVALGEGAAIAMFHRDGTMLARYPHAPQLIGNASRTRLHRNAGLSVQRRETGSRGEAIVRRGPQQRRGRGLATTAETELTVVPLSRCRSPG